MSNYFYINTSNIWFDFVKIAPTDQQKTVIPTSGGYANNNGVVVPSSNDAAEKANFHSKQRLTQSTPGSPQDHGRPTSFEVIGSAESLVGRVMSFAFSSFI